MKRKESELINLLLSANGPRSGRELADEMGVSQRSVKNYVKGINATYGANAILSSRNGYSINPNATTLLGERGKAVEEVPQTNEERIAYTVKQLVGSHTAGVDLFSLSNDLCIGYSTVRALIKRMNTMYEPFGVHFSTRNDTLRMEGTEESKRRFISSTISDELGSTAAGVDLVASYFPDMDVAMLSRIIRRTFRKHNYYLNDFAAINLIMHVVIIIDRLTSGEKLASSGEKLPQMGEHENGFFKELIASLEESFGVTFGAGEKYEIYVLFKSNANYGGLSFEDGFSQYIGQEVIDLVDHYVQEVHSRYLIDLSSDTFRTAFAAHIKNLLFRASHDQQVLNPLSANVKLESPVTFDIAVYIALDLIERYGIKIDEGETAFLAMHIGAELERQSKNFDKVPAVLICPDYLDLTERLTNALMLNFGGQLDIRFTVDSEAEVTTILERGERIFLILTCLPVRSPMPCKIVQLSPMSIREQLPDVQAAIADARDMMGTEELQNDFSKFFEEGLFVPQCEFATRDETIAGLSCLMVECGYVKDEFEQDVRRRDEAASTAFGRIAIPHSRNMDAAKTCVAVATSAEGIDWDGVEVNLVLLVAINEANRQVFRSLYESLIGLFSDERVINQVVACRRFEQFKSIVLGKS